MGRAITSLDDPEFTRPFKEFRYTAYRLEALQVYAVDYEREAFELFLAGKSLSEHSYDPAWINEIIAPAAAAGRRMHRVHVVELPMTDYVRFESWHYERNSAAGEEIRILPVNQGEWPDEVPRYDYWLFDSELLMSMHYDEAGRFVAAEFEDDPELIVRANHWRDAALKMSIPYREFADSLVADPA